MEMEPNIINSSRGPNFIFLSFLPSGPRKARFAQGDEDGKNHLGSGINQAGHFLGAGL